jgi:acyl carrier protein
MAASEEGIGRPAPGSPTQDWGRTLPADITLEAVRGVIASEADLPPTMLVPTRSVSEIGMGSFAIMRLVLALEERFGVELSNEELMAVASLPLSRLPELVRRAKPMCAD